MTLLVSDASILRVWVCNRQGRSVMLFLAAIARFALPCEPQSSDLSAQSHLGHVGLTVIALVYVLVTLWRQ
jgi:hypothetical protein